MITWAKIVASVLELFRALARFMNEQRIRQDERDHAELEAHREEDRIVSDVDHAVDQLRHDREAVANDPRNRNKGDTVSGA